MVVKQVEELQVWQRASVFWDAINDILDRPGLKRDRRLRDQLADAADSMLSNISEGFEQPTDRAFARYLYTSKGSTAEARTRLRVCWKRGYITREEFVTKSEIGNEVAKLTTGLIKYLIRSDRRDRGLGRRPTETDDGPPAETND
jgi:four helix bundle protein